MIDTAVHVVCWVGELLAALTAGTVICMELSLLVTATKAAAAEPLSGGGSRT